MSKFTIERLYTARNCVVNDATIRQYLRAKDLSRVGIGDIPPMQTFSESVRKITTVFLAAFLWLHALFFLNPQSAFVSKCSQMLRLTTSEVVLFSLLVLFSFAAGSGFWKQFRSLLYIYGFPFVLIAYGFYWGFLILRAMHRWFKAQSSSQTETRSEIEVTDSSVAPAPATTASETASTENQSAEVLKFLLRPFRRFTFLWCILLLVTTHIVVVWMCLVVVMLHLARDISRILKVLFFSGPWLQKAGQNLMTAVETAIVAISVVTPDTSPTPEMKSALTNLKGWTPVINFLKEPYLVSRWAWVLATFCFGSIYCYIAVLFSFAYYGLSKVNGISYPWPDALIASLFIPFFVSELPKILWVKLLGGLHCTLVLAVGIGTLVNFIQRRLRAIHLAAVSVSNRLADQNIRENFLLLEAKLATKPPADTKTTDGSK
jgi:hypothetical protein